jgi:two-component system, NarL family, nitrate/nitrite response regulator NarL
MNARNTTIRVMIIDDHKTVLWGLEKLIQGEAPRMEVVATATNREEALRRLAGSAPDLVLLDLDLGGEDGLELLPALLASARTQVLILTGERGQTTLDLAIVRGARGVLRKDVAADQVLKAIEAVHRGELWLDHESLSRVFGQFLAPAPPPEAQKNRCMALTSRESKIIQTMVEESGASNKTIAQRLFISEHTLRNHLSSIYQKLGVRNRLELYVYALEHKLAPGSGPVRSMQPGPFGSAESYQARL